MRPSQKLVDFIAAKEGFRSVAYRPLPTDRWTVGYGSTFIGGKPVVASQTISKNEAYRALAGELFDLADRIVEKGLPVGILQQQFDAVLSLVYNIGLSTFNNSNTGRAFYAGQDISDRFQLYNRSGGQVVQGLVNRRNEEREMYVSGHYGAENTAA